MYVYVAALFTIAKTWEQSPKCSLTHEQIKKDVVLYTMECYPAINKNKIMPFAATWMGLKIITLSEVNQKERQIPQDIIYMWNLKYNTNESIYENKNRIRDVGKRLVVPKRKEESRRQSFYPPPTWEFGIRRCKLIHTEG